jgi:hypothetical protein
MDFLVDHMEKHVIPVWFFVGLLLLTYGVLILATGLINYSTPSNTVLSELHAPVWWGAVLAVVGAIYTFVHWPGRARK